MPYKAVEDIPDLDIQAIDFTKINSLMTKVLDSTRFAMKDRYSFRKKSNYEDEMRAFLNIQLLIYQSTHNSIHALIKHSIQNRNTPSIADAASLAREQIEKMYSIALVLSNPHKWIKQNLRSDWRDRYQSHLLQLEEQGQSPRFQEHLQSIVPNILKKLQRPRSSLRTIKPEVIVSDFAVKVLTYYWHDPGGADPAWFKTWKKKHRKSKKNNSNINLRSFISNYFEFPTPGKSIRFLSNKKAKKFLYRWHKEYSYFSAYAHASFSKGVIPYLNESRNREDVEKLDKFADDLTSRILFTSYISVASTCTLIISELKEDYGAKDLLKEFWAVLNDSSLLARAVWNIYMANKLK